jgi:hypothetical protein
MAAILDQFGVKTHSSSASVNLSGTYTANTYYNIGVDRTDLSHGIYIIYVEADTHAAGVSQYSTVAASEPIAWSSTASNSNQRTSINFGTSFMGHAPNTYTNPNSMFSMHILHEYGSAGAIQELQITFANTMVLTNAAGRSFRIRIYRYQ